MKYLLALGLTVFLSGCVPHMQPISLTKKFNQSEAEALMKEGTNTIKGSALIRQSGGGIVTCAGTKVRLIPFTEYAQERMKHIYGDENGGYSRRGATFKQNNPSYSKILKSKYCDAQGFFKFEKRV